MRPVILDSGDVEHLTGADIQHTHESLIIDATEAPESQIIANCRPIRRMSLVWVALNVSILMYKMFEYYLENDFDQLYENNFSLILNFISNIFCLFAIKSNKLFFYPISSFLISICILFLFISKQILSFNSFDLTLSILLIYSNILLIHSLKTIKELNSPQLFSIDFSKHL